MPQLGETVTEGTITRWLKQVGDAVAVDDVLFEVSTDKVDTEVPSAFAGVPPRGLRPRGRHRAHRHAPGRHHRHRRRGPRREPSRGTSRPRRRRPISPCAAAAVTGRTASDRPRADLARLERSADASRADGTGSCRRWCGGCWTSTGWRPATSSGSGRDGRITRADVLAAAANRRPRHRAARTRPGARRRAGATRRCRRPGRDDEVIEFTRARRNTAEQHGALAGHVGPHAGGRSRSTTTPSTPCGGRPGCRSCPSWPGPSIDAIGEFPHVNASVGDDELIVHRRIHLGVAVDVDFQALVVPVVKDAGGKRLRAISDDDRPTWPPGPQSKRLTADDLTGGTFTITNVGCLRHAGDGADHQPAAGRHPVDRRRADAAGGGAGAERRVDDRRASRSATSASAFDHRAFDGAYAAAFLARVRDLLETRDWTQEV